MCFCGCGQSFFIVKVLEPGGKSRGRGRKNGRRKKKKKTKGDWRMDAQVLLLIDPGAELGWAELSERLPSAGGERKQDKRQLAICSLWSRTELK